MRSSLSPALLALVIGVAAAGCTSPARPQDPAPSTDAAFTGIANAVLEDLYRRHPTQSTFLGIHKYDDRLEDYSRQAVLDDVADLRLLHDGEADDSEAARGRQGTGRRRLLAAGVPRRLHRARAAAAAAIRQAMLGQVGEVF